MVFTEVTEIENICKCFTLYPYQLGLVCYCIVTVLVTVIQLTTTAIKLHSRNNNIDTEIRL